MPKLTLPESILLESTNICNIRCSMCFQSFSEYAAPRGFMSRALYRKCLHDIADDGGFHCIQLSLFGEPLLHPEIVDFVETGWKEFGFSIIFSTNALLLEEAMAEALVKAGLRALSVSLDAAADETYSGIRRGSDFAGVIKNIERFIMIRNRLNARRPRNLPTLSVKFAVQAGNRSEREQFTEMIKALDPDIQIVFQPLINWHTREGRDYTMAKRNVCSLGSEKPHLCVTWDGKMILCCMDYNRTVTFGDCAESNLLDLYNAKRFTEIRRAMREKPAEWEQSLPPICMKCLYTEIAPQ